ncbi:hypothetical protein F2Q68_00037777 [Brassica cretica]|uniref:GH10 domain-containing protein n=1 Tax=Brassica cretica TaxID=69181 RepID=A0A8S9GY70_BRACR|nr:hypothetical protein F2Q68_00037777 [Brassica cretica]
MCLENPYKPQYNGGIIVNPDLQNGSQGWSQFANAKVDFREFGGNKFVVARGRNQSYDSVSQKIYLEKGLLYTFSAWLQVSKGKAPVIAVFKKNGEYKHAGSVIVESKCWSMLKGGLTIDESGPAELYFETSKVLDLYNYNTIKNEILVRGHTVLWDDPKMQPSWEKKIKDPEDLMNVTLNRINSVMKRYKDPDVTLFVNEYNTIENPGGVTATPVKEKMEEILAYQGNENIKGAIGAQGHFSPTQPNLAYMRSALDTLGSLGLPVWITELDMPKCPNQAKYMEEILREAYSHPAVEGIIIFAGPEVIGFGQADTRGQGLQQHGDRRCN